MNQDLLEQVLNCPTLPTLPAVAVRVLELMQQPNVTMDALATIVQNDQGLSAKILKTVNSSFYGVRRPCSTINQAIVMLGLASVKSLALSFSLVTAIDENGSREFDYLSYWRRGLYTAVAAKCIAREAGLASEDEAFLGGLLQDIGMIGMYHGLGRKYLEVVVNSGGDHRTLVRHELAELELQHPDVGAMMCERWKLPLELIMPVRFHERPTAAPPDHADLVRSVGLGNIAHDVLTDDDPAESVSAFQARARQWFDFEPDLCNTLIHRIAEGAKQVSSLFRLSVGADADAQAIFEGAHAQLEAMKRGEAGSEPKESKLSALLTDSDEHDALTGVLTPQAIMPDAERAFTQARRASKSLTILVVGLDRLTSLTGSEGQDAADVVLVETGLHLSELATPLGGLVARWDDTSFCLIMPGIDRTEAVRTAGEIRVSIHAQSARWTGARAGQVTVSVGAATLSGDERTYIKVQQLITAALRARDAASGSGGNCVRAFVPKLAA